MEPYPIAEMMWKKYSILLIVATYGIFFYLSGTSITDRVMITEYTIITE